MPQAKRLVAILGAVILLCGCATTVKPPQGRGRVDSPLTNDPDRVACLRAAHLPVQEVGLTALPLLLPATPSYDPWAWLTWGREVGHLSLHTTGGPSWKPLPVMFTAVFAPFGRAQPDLWLFVARAGALMALAMVFKLTHRV